MLGGECKQNGYWLLLLTDDGLGKWSKRTGGCLGIGAVRSVIHGQLLGRRASQLEPFEYIAFE